MITAGHLRQIAREYIWLVVDQRRIHLDDIRWLKDNGGIFPQRIVKTTLPNGITETKKTPYQVDSDVFILFDIIPLGNKSSTVTDRGVDSMFEFELVINIYGRDADYLIHHINAYSASYEARLFLSDQKISLREMDFKIDPLDGFENQAWWVRRKITLPMNMAQSVVYDKSKRLPILDKIEPIVEVVGGE